MPAGLARLARRVDRRRLSGGLALGLLLGFLPCGLLYTALVAAAASGGPLAGGAAMLAFGLGTVPALVATGLAGHALRRAAGIRTRGLAGAAVMGANAVILWVLAWRMLTA
jgi:sulfite exporter TauE/SafE